MMALIIIAIGVLALAHFLYESVIAPSWRFRIRLEMFALRDRIRDLKIESPESFDDEAFEFIESSISTAVSLCSSVSFMMIARANREFAQNAAAARQAEERARRIVNCGNEEAVQAWNTMRRLVLKALVVNHAMFLVWLVPIAFGALLIGRISQSIVQILASPIREVQRLTETEDRLVTA